MKQINKYVWTCLTDFDFSMTNFQWMEAIPLIAVMWVGWLFEKYQNIKMDSQIFWQNGCLDFHHWGHRKAGFNFHQHKRRWILDSQWPISSDMHSFQSKCQFRFDLGTIQNKETWVTNIIFNHCNFPLRFNFLVKTSLAVAL